MIYVAGLDGGTANLGLAVVSYNPKVGPSSIKCVFADHYKTEPAHKKLNRRICTDDRIRLETMIQHVVALNERHPLTAMGIEWYVPMGKNRNGWKTGMVVGAGIAVCAVTGIRCFEQLPSDVKRLVGKRDASKAEVIAWAQKNISGFRRAAAHLSQVEGVMEHSADAACHAVVTVHEMHGRSVA